MDVEPDYVRLLQDKKAKGGESDVLSCMSRNGQRIMKKTKEEMDEKETFYLRKQLTSEVATEYMCVAGIPQVYQPKYKFTKASDYEGKVFFLCAMQTGNGPVTISGEWVP